MKRGVIAFWALWLVCVACVLTLMGAPGKHSALDSKPALTHPASGSGQPSRVVLVPLAYTISQVASLNAVSHSTPRHWTVQSTQRGARFGRDLACGADSNGDGFSDLLVGCPRFTGASGLPDGLAVLFQGSRQGLGTSPAWVTESPHPRAMYGASVAFCDYNGDKLADHFVGVPAWFGAGRKAGKVLCFPGSSNSIATQSSWFVPQNRELPYVPTLILSAGDVNGDGCEDLLAGSYSFSKGFPNEGAAFLYLGSKTGTVFMSSWQAYGNITNANFFSSAAALGDVNGDGYGDVAIGAPRISANGRESGRVYIYFGSPQGLQREPGWSADGLAAQMHFGASITRVGDINGDGLADFVVGAPGKGGDSTRPGSVYLYLGSRNGISRTPAWQADGAKPNNGFGFAVAGGGDFDGDGYGDLLVGAPYVKGNSVVEGELSLFRGNGQAFSPQPDWILGGGQTGCRLGTVVRCAGDINGDGFADFAVASSHYQTPRDGTLPDEGAGRVDVFFGGTNGFRTGQFFPTDGINSKPYADLSIASPTLGAVTNRSLFAQAERLGYLASLLILGTLGVTTLFFRRGRERAKREERVRIARDLHDDLGAQITRLQRESAATNPEAAREAVLALDRAVWTVNPENDTLENLISFLGQYAVEFFAGSGIRLRFHAPVHVPNIHLDSERRKNILFAVKEALNNVHKHSAATETALHVAFEPPLLRILVEDNGRGFPPEILRGNGLSNMSARMQALHGRVDINASDSGGALVSFRIKI
jgi:hypothetical protein